MPCEPPGLVVGAEHRRMGAAVLLQPEQAAMLRIAIEEQRVSDVEDPLETPGQSATNRKTS